MGAMLPQLSAEAYESNNMAKLPDGSWFREFQN
jgi:hypothetical protein